jgi:hypothetical protein
MAGYLYFKVYIYFMIFGYFKDIFGAEYVINEDKLQGLKDFCGLEKDGLVDGYFRNVHFVYHLNFRCTVLGRTFKVSLPVTKGTKNGLICLILCSRSFKVANDWHPCRVQRQTRWTDSLPTDMFRLTNIRIGIYS